MTTRPDEAWLAPEAASAASLPTPTTERWQPLRLGLVDMFYYDDEQFWFHDGRLLLRGNNGTGKSKVLALTLPFLLDGSVLPRRVEPDADPKKRMEWNLLLGGAHPHTERTGYTWVEFGRRDAGGAEHFTTLGIGIKAASGRGIVKTWYFTTSRRIGDLHLLDEARTVLGVERLKDEIAGSGQVYGTQEAYRRGVDEALFRLGEERYAALIDLLIQLRQPQLSKKPDEKALSAALTEALTPLDQAVVADVAESFRSLEEERNGIADAKDTLRAAEDFLKDYGAYAKVAARRHTTAVRTANSDFEWAGRDLHQAKSDLADVVTHDEQLATRQDAAEQRRGTLQGSEQALRASPEMRDAERLEQEESATLDAEERAKEAEAEEQRAEERAQQAAAAERDATLRAEDTAREVATGDAAARRLAATAGLGSDHDRITTDAADARRTLDRRWEQISHVRRLVDQERSAAARAEQERRSLDTAETSAASREEDVRTTADVVATAVTSYREAVQDYLAALSELTPRPDAEELSELAEDWANSQDGESPVRAAVDAATAETLETLARRRAAADQDGVQISERLAAVHARIADLEAGRDPEPPAASGRDPQTRTGVAGAPLWRVVDFVDEVPAPARAGVEAALESAGLLDAWLFPDGTLQARGDVVLGPAGPPADGDSLAMVLTAAVGPDDDLPTQAVVDVLRRIGLGEASGAALWVDPAGRWGAGPARGTWTKERAEYVGAGARESHRRELLTRLRSDAAELDDALASVRALIAEIEERISHARAEHARYPTAAERDLIGAHADLAAAERESVRAAAAVALAHTDWERATAVADEAAAAVAEAAAELETGTTVDDLEKALAVVSDYAEALAELRAATRSAEEAETARAASAARAADAFGLLAERSNAARELRVRAATLRARVEALRATVGSSVAQLQAELGKVTGALTAIAGELKALEGERRTAAGQLGTLRQKVRELEVRREETAAVRESKVEALRAFAVTGLLRIALPTLAVPEPDVAAEWNLTAAVAVARAAEQQLDGTDESEEAWSRAQQRVSNAATELASQMSRHGHMSFLEQRGDVMVSRVRYLSDEIDIDRLAERLAVDVADRERLLSAREREILENHLVNEVAGHLHELLLAAETQIQRMNRELADRKTSTGMQLRVRWRERPDAPAGLSLARELMIRSDATWTAADRTAIGDFLQAQIAQVRDADPAGSWQEHLETALDYRQWHAFVIERWQNGQWRSASGPASGGEKALAVSVPLFAAAASHYNSADERAPRLILLDEAFAGVDDDSRAKSLGLLATFDLDVVMTSEREWGCYPQVPGLSIAQLSRVEGVDAVGVTRWRWDGRRRQRVEEVDEAARAGRQVVEALADDSLFG